MKPAVIQEAQVYKPKSKMQELAEEFRKSKEISEEYQDQSFDLAKKKRCREEEE